MNGAQPVGAFSAEFDVAAFSTGATPADGWSFNFSPNPPLSHSGTPSLAILGL